MQKKGSPETVQISELLSANKQPSDIITVLSVECRIIRPFQQIVNRHTEIIGKQNQRLVIGFTGAVFIAADAVLIHIQFNGKPLLRDAACKAQFFQSHKQIPLDIIIPLWYNKNIPIWDIQ